MKSETENIFIIGSGGREHALGWRLHRDNPLARLYFAPGNGGTSQLGTNAGIAVEDVSGLAAFASDNQIGLTVVGPEIPLAAGLVDQFTKDGREIFGPSQKAARLETDKAWAAGFMDRHRIPQPGYRIFTDIGEARSFLAAADPETIVIKASGLAAGKGVVLPITASEAIETATGMLEGSLFGDAGRTVVVQERLKGRELSLMAFCDGERVVPLLPARDHKRIFDGNRGPNTGGMGAYAPVPDAGTHLLTEIYKHILVPTVLGMKSEGTQYRGILYAGLMLTESGPKVLEYNVRFGDPETQPLMLLLQSPLATVLKACIRGGLSHSQVEFRAGAAVCVVMAAAGYPGKYRQGTEITLPSLPSDPDVVVFHAGTAVKNGKLVTSGGRVLGVTAYGANMDEAVRKAYRVAGVSAVYDGMRYRTDIGPDSDVTI